ncbi:hemerythrin domain-containing protein [Ideonella paludis]|uniref:Hemerythrin domain-containing protein n=1 Tax=Ideonella paludis TaxID=1233411 RepID=A0ABS5E313_9BURK|nr:hemerythrin domain-containing protein [Ideonella paludis]MBQ0937800.1 hemerythrin domain-containing protein [Ideonella paludis]
MRKYPSTDRFRRDHREINRLLDELCQYLYTKALVESHLGIRIVLARLSSRFLIHVCAENEILYPMIVNSNIFGMVGKEFRSDSDRVHDMAVEYFQRWRNSTIIRGHSDAFICDTRNFANILRSQIEKENKILYSIFDSLPSICCTTQQKEDWPLTPGGVTFQSTAFGRRAE